jgi:hypothetical protein
MKVQSSSWRIFWPAEDKSDAEPVSTSQYFTEHYDAGPHLSFKLTILQHCLGREWQSMNGILLGKPGISMIGYIRSCLLTSYARLTA